MLEEIARSLSDDSAGTEPGGNDAKVDLHGVVLFDDIRDFVFEISDEGLRKELMYVLSMCFDMSCVTHTMKYLHVFKEPEQNATQIRRIAYKPARPVKP